MEGGRKREPNGRDEERVGGYINSYLTAFGFLHPRMRSFSPLSLTHSCFLFPFCTPFLPFRASTPLGISCIQCAWMCVCAFACVGWCVVGTVSPNIFCGVFCLLEQVNFSDAERQYAKFQLSSLFFLFIYLFTFNLLYESGSVGLFTKISFGLDIACRYVIFFFF